MNESCNNYLGVYVEVGDSKNFTDLEESLDILFNMSMKSIRYYIGCQSPEIVIPNSFWNKRKDHYDSKNESYCQDLTNLDIQSEIKNFKEEFKNELQFLVENYNDVNVKFGWINYII